MGDDVSVVWEGSEWLVTLASGQKLSTHPDRDEAIKAAQARAQREKSALYIEEGLVAAEANPFGTRLDVNR